MSWLKKGLCALFGHQLKVLRIFWDRTRKVECERCKRQFRANLFMEHLEPWDKRFEEIYKNDDRNFFSCLDEKEEDAK
jgi:hypothetical protein